MDEGGAPSCFVSGEVGLPQSLLCGSFYSPNGGLKTTTEENWCQSHLADQKLHRLLEKVDLEFAEAAHQQGCIKLVMGNRTKGGIRFLGSVFPRPRSV